MSKKRHTEKRPFHSPADGIVVRTFVVRHTNDYVIPPHAHDWHQLIYASEGVMWVQTAEGDWVVPPNRAVWVPAGVEHGIEMTGTVLVQTLYLSTRLAGNLPKRCCAVNVSPLLRELIRHTVTLGMLDKNDRMRARLIGVLLDQLGVLPTIPLQLPWPQDPRAQRAAAWLRAHLDDPGFDATGGQASGTQHPHPRASLSKGNGAHVRQMAATIAPAARAATLGGRPPGDGRRSGSRIREPERLHRHV
jgi:mannose-6-phosphate isomerase-like protein (cupin superfamily)